MTTHYQRVAQEAAEEASRITTHAAAARKAEVANRQLEAAKNRLSVATERRRNTGARIQSVSEMKLHARVADLRTRQLAFQRRAAELAE